VSPTVSVVIPAFNRASTLGRAIESCRAQTRPVAEIVVVDDGSTDGTPALLSELSRVEPRLVPVRLPRNRGAQAARLEGIRASRSDWIAFLDSDDELLPDSVRARLAAASSCGFEPGLVYGDVLVAGSGEETRMRLRAFSGQAFRELCRLLSFAYYGTLLVRRRCFETCGYPSPDFPAMQDEDMVLTVAKLFPVLHCGADVVRSHPTPGRLSDDWRASSRGSFLLLRKYRPDILRFYGPVGYFFAALRAANLSLYFWLESGGRRVHPLGRAGPWLVSGVLRRVLALDGTR
jgi:glycosyltransferase involved in cell wall biosynthesis